MRPWLTRALGMALLHGVADTALAKATVYTPTGLSLTKIVTIALLVGAAALWSAIDAWLTVATARRASSGKKRETRLGRDDLGRTWLIAALVAGPLSGILYVIGRALLVDQSGADELLPALTGGAAFTALLVLIPAGLGMFVGLRLKPARKAVSETVGEPGESWSR
jgi:hypothetical protein